MRHPRARRFKVVCSGCGSQDVLCDAYAEWDVEAQQWELASTFQKGAFCNACDRETTIEQVEISPDKDSHACEVRHG